MRRLILAGLLLSLALLALPGLALAHAELTASEPAAGSTVPAGLSRIVLAFTEPPALGSTIALYTGDFEAVPGVDSYVANGQLWADLDPPLPAGTYSVQWSALSTDGHSVQGSFEFAVADEASAPFPWPAFVCVLVVLILVGSLPFLFARLHRRTV
ncbi:MAG: copper resistance protein CopC [Anaerolineales bacterium]|nr:copper resistance protein CopC [Anaerolineales bacterium]